MNKKIYYLLVFCLGITFSLASCSSDDDNAVNEEWKAYQDAEFTKVSKDVSFKELQSEANNGSVYWKESSVITDSDNSSLRISPQGTPEFTDTVVVRYEGWYFDLNGKKYIFDSTENPSTGSSVNPNKSTAQFAVNAVIQGWTTLLQDMKTGEEREVCIPQQLAYGSSGSTTIPGYTTLWFRIKLFKIISMSGLKD